MAVQRYRFFKEIAELSEKKNFIISVSRVGNKDNFNVKFKSEHPLFLQTAMTVNIDMAGDYPFRPPSVRFAHEFHHPNVDRGGDICIPILCFDNWKPATTLENIMMSLLELLAEPDLSRPIRFDIADEYVKWDSSKTATKGLFHLLNTEMISILYRNAILFTTTTTTTTRGGMGGSWRDFCGGGLWHNPFPDGLPNVSLCFQHTILVWIPVGFFWVLFPFFMAQATLTSRKHMPLPWSHHLILKIAASFFITMMSLFFALYTAFSSSSFPPSDMLYPVLWSVTFGCTTVTHVIRKKSGMVTSGILHLSSIAFLVCGGPQFYQSIRDRNNDGWKQPLPLRFAYLTWYSALTVYVFLMCFADARITSEKTHRSVELDGSFVNRSVLWWFNPVPWKGARKDLEPEDLFDLNEGSTTKYLSDLWEQHWEPRMKGYLRRKEQHSKSLSKESKKKEPTPPSVVGCLFTMFRWEFLTATALKATSDTMQFVNPFLLHQLIGFISDPLSPLWIGLSFSILMFAVSEVRSLILNAYYYVMMRMGIKFQTVLMSAVYKKTLKLSNTARRNKTVGEIVNLMAIDVERIQMITPEIQQFWSCPYQIVLGLTYLFITLGYSAIPGLIIMVICLPTNIISSIIVKKWQVEQMKLKDERTKMLNEVLNGIKVGPLFLMIRLIRPLFI
ncbi:hypothetical protein Y032_0816g2502 [Ancylostoma ceylanicum]|uniref:UBC core domain-containing protein n=1 Tax=Ancylostoma ceylanicum TaxID=53326 RepID=A0A016WDW5_9BILA|nr:hypothetical protein Y032_0816g2502 [Ancylostoma ceylanicum]